MQLSFYCSPIWNNNHTSIPLKPKQLKVRCTVVYERMKKARKDKTIAEKLDLLDRYKTFSLMSQREAAERLGVSRGSLQGLIKNKATIRAATAASSVSGVKRKRSGKDEMEKALFDWFRFTRQRNPPVNGPILMEKENKIAEAAGHSDFKATEGWFSRRKKRFSVEFVVLKG